MGGSIRMRHGAQWLRRQNEILRLLAIGAVRERVLSELAELLRLEFPEAAIALVVRADGEPFLWSGGGGGLATAALYTVLGDDGELDRAEGWFPLEQGAATPRWDEFARAAGFRGLWIEPLHDVDGLRIGQLLIALSDRSEADSSAQTLARVGATIAGLIFQRDSAVARLQQGRELYRSLLDNHPDAVLHIDADWHIRSGNEAARQTFGLGADDMHGQPLSALFDEATQASLQMRLPSVLRGIAQSMEATALRPGGARPRELELILVPLRDRARSSGLFVIARDVTRFRASERALRRTYEQSLLRRDQLLELNRAAIDSSAIDDVQGLLLQLARSMVTIAGVDFVRLSLQPVAAQQHGSEVVVVLTKPPQAEQARLLPAELRRHAAGLVEPQRADWSFPASDGENARGRWLGMSLRADDGAVVGTLEWFGPRDSTFDDDDEVLLMQFAQLSVSNVQRVWLHHSLREAERDIAHQLAFVHAMTASIGEGLYAIDRDGRLTFINPAASEILGWEAAELQDCAAESRFAVPHPEAPGPAARALLLDSRISEHSEFIARDGRRIPVDLVASPLHLYGRATGAVVVFRDISERLLAEQARLERDRFFALSLELFVIVDAKGHLFQFNTATTRLLRRSAEELFMSNWRDHAHPDDFAITDAATAQILSQGRVDAFVNRWIDADGEIHWLEWTASLTPDQRIFAVARDITERRRYENELAHLASHDTVTGLPRIEQIETFLSAWLAGAALRGSRVSVFYLDLDRFRLINDSRGHAIGDQVLRTVAQRLLDSVGEQGKVARIAGDEFLVVRSDGIDAPDQQELGEALRLLIEQPINLGLQQVFLTCSVGVSCFPENGTAALELVQQAEAAMIRAKDEGRNAVASFSNEQSQALKDRRELGSGLRAAIANEELVLHFQPQIGAHDWQVRGVEALVRWNSPVHGLLPPGRFIPVAEELGIIVELGQWVLESACRKAREWLDSGLADFTVAVNVSALQLQRPDFLERVRRALEVSRLPPRYLELELTESMVMAHVERVIVAMRSLKALGVSLSLDDFGSGYSSLNYLRQFPIDKLKIDQSFVRDIITDPGSAGICRAVIALGHQLGMTVSAEGVETIGQAAFLRRSECDQFQGNYFCLPMPEAQTFDVLRRRYLRQDADTELARPSSTETLLLLDDEENVLRALVRLLRRDGYNIETATNARQAFEILAAQPVQVIISDQRMPDISGTEFLSRVKDLYPDTVRLILSGYSDFASLTEAVNRGAVYRYVAKPWDDEELRRMVREAFRMAAG
ncbi:EAL domain-containing protein [Tahibacter sp.]|uniref:EAL domain-containing protein n=1 Tax=Tahibacter sp. TaxID=2056211 RepID=UPI0028C4348F|nr:EAL domain-containing protein [Tahibacter sp.]